MEGFDLPAVHEDMSAIDHLFALAKQNSELTSIAIVSLEEMLRGALSDGWVCPLSTRQLDGQDRNSTEIQLRQVMVGAGGSICTIRDVLEAFIEQHGREMIPRRDELKKPISGKLQSHAAAVMAEPGGAEGSNPREGRDGTALLEGIAIP
jgi:hypothetical protein